MRTKLENHKLMTKPMRPAKPMKPKAGMPKPHKALPRPRKHK